MFRGLRPDEIDVRVGSVSAKGVSLLLYKDARCDMNILDETYGPEGWQRKHEVINGNLYCGIGIYNKDTGDWVWKWDCGTESRKDGEGNEKKGEASDSFKRAAFNVGIGRELYTAGFTFVQCPTKAKTSGKGYELVNPYQFSGAYVSDIRYKETEHKREITGLVIKDSKGVTLYSKFAHAENNSTQTNRPVEVQSEIPDADIESIRGKVIDRIQLASLEAELKRTGVKTIQVVKEYSLPTLREMKLEQYVELMKRLEKVPTKKKTDLGL
jgi:hypothetical protein